MKPSKFNTAKMSTAALALTALICATLILSLSGKDPGRAGVVSSGDRSSPAKSAQLPKPDTAQVSDAYGKLPLMFEANTGQTDSRVKFISRGSGYRLFFTSTEAVLTLSKPAKYKGRKDSLAMSQTEDTQTIESPAVLRMKVAGANPAPQVEGQDQVLSNSNYFIGNKPEKWRTNVTNYAKVKYQSVYPGVDLIYYGNQRQLEYDFVVAPGADPKAITLDFQGADKLKVEAQGDLVLMTKNGEVRFQKPVVYQEVDGVRREISGTYILKGAQEAGFHVAAYDERQPLIIDPVLSYSTYLGGSFPDWSGSFSSIAVDSSGSAYVVGYTISTNFPTTAGAFQITSPGDYDAFVTKLNPEGSGLVYSTYLGGSSPDLGYGIAVDSSGSAYLTGRTESINFPITDGAFQKTAQGGRDAFITKLDPTGSALAYSTYLGGVNWDDSRGVVVDSSGSAYVAGYTESSTNFPTTVGAFQTTGQVNGDAFVTKFNPTGSALVYSTYLAANGQDVGEDIAMDSSGCAYVIGATYSANFPTTSGAFDTMLNPSAAWDAFITKLNPTGSALVYSSYLGGNAEDIGFGIAVDTAGSAYIIGRTISIDFPTTPGAFQTVSPGNQLFYWDYDAFITKLNPTGEALVYSTYLGGSKPDYGQDIVVDSSGCAYVTGTNYYGDFPTTADALQTVFQGGSVDAFVTKLNSAGSALVYSTYLGGVSDDGGQGIAVDSSGSAYVAGATFSSNFPTTGGAFQTTPQGSLDAFVAKISPGISPLTPPVAKCKDIQVSANSSCQASIVAADVDDGSFDPDTFDSIVSRTVDTSGPLGLGSHVVTLTLTDTHFASSSCTATVMVVDNTMPTFPSLAAPINYGVGSYPYSVTTGDFNGDSKIDLATANIYSNSVSILLGNGNGTFQAAVNYGAGSYPASVTAGDFNADSRMDLATANIYSNSVSILLGNGNGTFQAAVNYGTGYSPVSIAVRDFNGDSRLDVATANLDSNDVSILLANGNGTFLPPVNYSAGYGPASVAVGDFNGDSKIDLVTANSYSSDVSILLGNGNGTFQLPVNYSAGYGPASVAVGDFNGDSKIDLVTANSYSNDLAILLGNGTGTFYAPVNYGTGSYPVSVAVGDLNCDSRLDLVTANLDSNDVSILLGNDNGTFQAAINYGTGNYPYSVAVRDFSGDSKMDLAVANLYSNAVSILLNTGTCIRFISAPSNINCQAAIPNVLPQVIASDSCGSVTISQSPAAGTLVGVGSHTITITATDGSNNSQSVTTTFTVVDTTPPVISCPQNITAEPTSSAGAAVSFTSPTTTDSCDSSLNVSCSRVSGSSFAIGTTTVNCTVTDDHPNSSVCSFAVTVLTPTQVASNLINSVTNLIASGVLTKNQSQGLLDKLQAIKDALNKGKTVTACNQLNAFISQVNGFVGSRNLTAAQAQPLINSATNMKKTLGCP